MAPAAPDADADKEPSVTGSEKSPKRDKRRSNTRSSNVPTTFFIKSQDQIDAGQEAPAKQPEDSMFGVESLKDTIDAADRLDTQNQDQEDPQPSETPVVSGGPPLSMPAAGDTRAQLEHASAILGDRPLSLSRAPHLYHSPNFDSGPLSTPKSASMRSFRLSDDDLSVDDASSQALASSDEGDEEEHHMQSDQYPIYAIDEAAPQLVMPSIRMPARRPFTQRGKDLGKLKLMVAGSAGTGKTSLIRSIVQTCDDIVHVDPLDSSAARRSSEPEGREISGGADRGPHNRYSALTEIQASTRPYPAWWADLDESRLLKRRRSIGDTILERNVSFIDTPGFHDRLSFELHSTSIVNFIQGHLHRNASLASLGEGEVIGILSGTGGFQVDLILYLLSGVPDAEEIAFIRRLCQLTNLVPVLSKTDLRPHEDVESTRLEIARALRQAGVNIFELRKYSQLELPHEDAHSPFTTSCAPSRDDDNMDASLLMSSGYVAPLEPSQLATLVSAIFEPDMAACLRHSASKKYIQWHRSFSVHAPSMSLHSIRPGRLQSRAVSSPSPVHFGQSDTSSISAVPPLSESPDVYDRALRHAPAFSTGSGPPSSSNTSPPLFPLLPATNAYTVARIIDHTQREERMAQAHLARWATDLQRALRNERAQFAALQQAERQAWLQERLEECVSIDACRDGKVGSDAIVVRQHDGKPRGSSRQLAGQRLNQHDPMGLLRLRETLSRRGLLLAQVMGGAGVAGAVMIWMMRTWGWEMSAALDGGFVWRGASTWSWSRE